MLSDQLRRQVVVELAGVHPTRTLASRSMDDVREALREGLREEAAPISRRLAEVKGLSNNAIRRLDGIEQTLASERDARLDDLTLLVELLTEGWRVAERAARPDRSGTRAAAERRAAPRQRRLAEGLAHGKSSSNRDPRPTSESSSSDPPSIVESSFAIASPSPVPPPV